MTLETARWAKHTASGWLVCAALLCGSPAAATGAASPATGSVPGLAPPAGVEPGDPLYLFSMSGGSPKVVGLDLMRGSLSNVQHVNFGFRNRQIKVIHYAAPVRVAQRDMTIKLDAPGAGRSIVAFELVFY